MMLHLSTPIEQHLAGGVCAALILLMGGLLWYVMRWRRGEGA
jgi:hypothetical protein